MKSKQLLKEYIPYPDSIFISSETNLSKNYIVGRKIDATNPNMFFVYNQYFGKFLPINKNKTIESVLAGSKLH